MADEGKRRVQSKGEITLPKEWLEENNISKGEGEYVTWKKHSRDNSKLIIEVED